MGLIPELRADKNGKMVTRHVRNGQPVASQGNIPAPQLGAKKKAEPKASTTQKRHEMISIKYASEDLRKAASRNGYVVDICHFTCSDEEAYSVLSVVGFDDALALLNAGIRTKHEAQDFLAEHNLRYLEEDNSELVREAIERKMPAIPAIEGFKYANPQRPTYFDAAEAYSIKTLRDATGSPIGIPHMVLMDEISLEDIKHIGATRLAKAEKNMIMGVTDELKAIHAGTSKYDIDTLKKLIIKEEENYGSYLIDSIRFANTYGADLVLGLKNYYRGLNNLDAMRKSELTVEDKGKIIQLEDNLEARKISIPLDNVMKLHDAGVPETKIIEGLEAGLSVPEIIALHEGVEASLTSGWL